MSPGIHPQDAPDLTDAERSALRRLAGDYTQPIPDRVVLVAMKRRGLVDPVDTADGWDWALTDAGRVALEAQAGPAAVESATSDAELPGMWERADFTGGVDEVRGSEVDRG